jgi:hypothetical protein
MFLRTEQYEELNDIWTDAVWKTYIYIYIYIHTYTHACMHTYINVLKYIHTSIRTYLRTYTHRRAYRRTHAHTHMLTFLWLTSGRVFPHYKCSCTDPTSVSICISVRKCPWRSGTTKHAPKQVYESTALQNCTDCNCCDPQAGPAMHWLRTTQAACSDTSCV